MRAAAALGVTALLAGCGEEPERFLVRHASRGPIEATVSATGTLNPVYMVEVGTYASGRIESVEVDYNSPVTKGQLVAKIDPANALVRVQKARANVLSAQARLMGAQADLGLKGEQLQRQQALHAETTVSRDRFESAETAHAQASAQVKIERAQLAEREAELEDANVNLAHTDIRSPVDGIVLSKNVNVGQTVAASFQTPTLFLIAQDLSQMQVNSDVSEADIGQVAPGQRARFSVDAFPERVFEGRVRQVRNAPVSVQNVVTYDVVVDFDNSELLLRPGMTATLTIIAATRDDVLKVPRRALRFRPRGERSAISKGNLRRLWVEKEAGVAESLEVRVGLGDDEFVEVSGAGLEEGDAVIVGYWREP
ncbi:MAG: efflux RND transporter periplasmic adaptor subunit [Myxococcota bacterium]|nr:efflux RND transporter periplasmic adaptor subunit [Myxococcota bacterium]